MFAPLVASPTSTSSGPQRVTVGPRRPSQAAIEQMQMLQRTIGNQATLRLVTQRAITSRSEPGGHEREARRLAELVVGQPGEQLPTREDPGSARGLRTSEPGGSAIQAVLASLRAPPSVHRTLSNGGQPLGGEARAELEPSFGFDFAAVRLHADADASRSARDLNARAYTVGNHIVFDAARVSPDSPTGRRVLAHELTHVVQQSGGGAAVLPGPEASDARLPISPSDVTLHCDDKSDEANAAYERRIRELVQNRPGAAWPYGPITKHKSATHDLFDYYMWVRIVERAYGPDKQQVLQRLRRVYYSGYSGKGEYDSVIAHLEGTGGDAPLDARLIPLDVIDSLYETNVLRLPDGELIDVSHVLTALDTKTAGLTDKAGGAEGLYGVDWMGVVTWAGDLASWFVNWIDKRPDPSPASSRAAAQKVDLISDMDGQILAAEKVRPATIETIKAEHRILEHSNVVSELSKPVSVILNDYFGIGMGTAQPPNLKNRFAAFVRVASPPIPHRSAHGGGSGAITLTGDAEEAIYNALRGTARLLIEKGHPDGSGEQVVSQNEAKLHEVARQFTQFLRTGLAASDAAWGEI